VYWFAAEGNTVIPVYTFGRLPVTYEGDADPHVCGIFSCHAFSYAYRSGRFGSAEYGAAL
jgi:hypothetical protein